ncbi:hypothetical protein KKB68_02410 [Patescibacteria group bacterium]|nr:hypothetical protein [Patescibacteria group bacterium]
MTPKKLFSNLTGQGNKMMENDDFLPRNEYEMCGFFEDLLFIKTEKFLPEIGPESEELKLKLTDKDAALLDKAGVLNRIFRRWFQTTWLYEGESKHFKGATPRQELTELYPDLENGWDFMSVKLTKSSEQWKVAPRYFSKKWLEEEKNVFEYGLKNLKDRKEGFVEPQLDCEFEVFIDWLSLAEKVARKISPKMKFDNDFVKYLMLFLEMAPANIILNCKMDLTKEKFGKASIELRNYIFYLFKNQARGKDNYWDIDDVFFNCWNILREVDKGLVSYENIIDVGDRAKRIRENKLLQKSAEVLYRLGVAFDRDFLFPLDRYFGGMEVVWSGKQAFLNELAITINLLKKNLKIERNFETEKRFLDIGDIAYDVRYIWFAPSTSFRFLDSIYRYFD